MYVLYSSFRSLRKRPRAGERPSSRIFVTVLAGLRPELGRYMKRAHLRWQKGGANGELLVEIWSICYNIEGLLIQRGNGDKIHNFDGSESEDVDVLCRILRRYMGFEIGPVLRARSDSSNLCRSDSDSRLPNLEMSEAP